MLGRRARDTAEVAAMFTERLREHQGASVLIGLTIIVLVVLLEPAVRLFGAARATLPATRRRLPASRRARALGFPKGIPSMT
jgi:hypothetical protein